MQPKSLLSVARPHIGVEGLSGHSPLHITWPSEVRMLVEHKPLPRQVAEDANMPDVLSRLQTATLLD